MARRSMVKTSPETTRRLDNKNPENRQVQSVETPAYNRSAVLYGERFGHDK